MQSNLTLFSQRHAVGKRHPSKGSSNAVQQWSMLIGLPLVGLLALAFLLSLGGVFAWVGPWLLFFGISRATKQETRLHETCVARGLCNEISSSRAKRTDI